VKSNEMEAAKKKAHSLKQRAPYDVHMYQQLNGLLDMSDSDSLPGDADGDALVASHWEETRSGAVSVRIQVLAGTAKEDVIRLLSKMLDWYERDDGDEYASFTESYLRNNPSAAEPRTKDMLGIMVDLWPLEYWLVAKTRRDQQHAELSEEAPGQRRTNCGS